MATNWVNRNFIYRTVFLLMPDAEDKQQGKATTFIPCLQMFKSVWVAIIQSKMLNWMGFTWFIHMSYVHEK